MRDRGRDGWPGLRRQRSRHTTLRPPEAFCSASPSACSETHSHSPLRPPSCARWVRAWNSRTCARASRTWARMRDDCDAAATSGRYGGAEAHSRSEHAGGEAGNSKGGQEKACEGARTCTRERHIDRDHDAGGSGVLPVRYACSSRSRPFAKAADDEGTRSVN
ncbi:hypothetical protein BD311DRAFT_100411 [Dichomitus squalens]|uniref:Uncharacterized protein n=1 Tax=Dichomitus squalens TaxID=114155 RepID=A0A4V2K168_9APHY|nr:hypothetical protein BD311DRAFT_100411 [Dichomitus squalens]